MSNGTVNVTKKSEAEVVYELTRQAQAVTLVDVKDADGRMAQVFVTRSLHGDIVVKGVKDELDEYLPVPDRRWGIATLGDLASFIDHANRFKTPNTVIFADDNPKAPKLQSVINYHAAEGPDGKAGWCDHRGVYNFPLSEEWRAWTQSNVKAVGQAEFASWIEGRILDVIDPQQAGEGTLEIAAKLGISLAGPAKILEVSRGLSLRVGASIKNHTTLATGEVKIEYITEHSDTEGGPVKVPGGFAIGIPVFRSGQPFVLIARLRYRVVSGQLNWYYELHGVDRVLELSLREASTAAALGTGLPLFVGTPEEEK